MDLIEKMARAKVERVWKGLDAEYLEKLASLAWPEYVNEVRADLEFVVAELPEKSTGIGQRSPDYVRGFNEARNVIVNALAPKDSPNGR